MRCAPGSPARPWRPSSPRRSSPRWRGRSGSSDSREMATRPVHVVSREVPPELQLRMVVAIGIVCAAFALVGLRLWYLQVERGAQMRYYSEKNRIRLVRVPAPRGVVYDRNGEIGRAHVCTPVTEVARVPAHALAITVVDDGPRERK